MILVNNISKKYSNGTWGIKDFSFKINDGQIFCIAGPNGSGKTTIINCILNIITPTKGDIIFNHEKIDKEVCKKRMAYVPDDTLLIESLTGKEYLDFVCSMYELKDDIKKKALLILFDMEKALNQVISTYSHGMKKNYKLFQHSC